MRYGARSLRQRASQAALELGNAVRRVVISATTGDAWGFLGYEYPDLRGRGTTIVEGEDDDPVEVFSGIGIFARPSADDRSEALLLNVGGKAEHGVIAAIRNEDARKRYVEEFGELEPGEVAIYNSAAKSRVIVRADGDIEIEAESGKEILLRSAGGTAEPLATKADLDALASHVDGHTHAGLLGGTGSVLALTTPPASTPSGTPDPSPSAAGTSVLKGE